MDESAQPIDALICRMCIDTQHCEQTDPMMELGCSCKGDLAWAHRSCIVAWFAGPMLQQLKMTCEICRKPLGHVVRAISLVTGLMTHCKGYQAKIENLALRWPLFIHLGLPSYKDFTTEEIDSVAYHIQMLLPSLLHSSSEDLYY